LLGHEYIKKIFEKNKVNQNGIFYDLGCGTAELCIEVAANYNLKKIIGIEANLDVFIEATSNVIKHNLTKRIWLWHDFIEKSDFSDATIAFYSLKPSYNHILHLKKMLGEECVLITPRLPIPLVIPSDVVKINDDEFFITKDISKNYVKNADEWVQTLPNKDFKTIDGLFEEYPNDKSWIKEIFENAKTSPILD
jgi:hypothetical protein